VTVSLKDIQFPIYRLGLDKPSQYDGVLYYESIKTDKEGKKIDIKQIVDDTKVKGNSLAMRRLVMMSEGINLKPIKNAIFFISDFIKLATAGTWFIDSSGMLFQHTKSVRAKLVFRPINKVIPIATGGAKSDMSGYTLIFTSSEPEPYNILSPTGKTAYAALLVQGT